METHVPSVQTLRLLLRPLQPEDTGVLERIYQGEDVLRYFPNPTPPPLERIRRFLSAQQAHWDQYGYGNWGILPAGEVEMIGWAGLQFLPEIGETEVGFLLDRRFWGKGYATEVGRAALRFGFQRFKMDHIIALVHPENLASRRVIEKCGLRYVDTLLLWGMDLMRHRIDLDRWDGLQGK